MTSDERYARQSFLGAHSEEALRESTVAIVGLGGGGSHVAQQLAHVGAGTIQVYDPDRAETHNLNRLIGATAADARDGTPKVEIAARLMRAINPSTRVEVYACAWQLAAAALREADIIISCVDSYIARQDIEVTARRFLIPLADMGMDVHVVDGRPHVSGQVILTLPGGPCLRCLGFLTETGLRQEAERYGAAGGRPQVVWTNGVLASVLVGIVVGLLTGWQTTGDQGEYLHYDGNGHQLTRSPRLQYASQRCPHFSAADLGEPRLP
jgi:molybdopterin-synthase adenylyltransferase